MHNILLVARLIIFTLHRFWGSLLELFFPCASSVSTQVVFVAYDPLEFPHASVEPFFLHEPLAASSFLFCVSVLTLCCYPQSDLGP